MLKSRKLMLSLLALSTLVASQIAMATPGNISIRLDCPDIADHGTEKVTNYGSVLTGPGIERVGPNDSTYPVFAGVNPGGVPINLVAAQYSNAGTGYSPSTGVVTCTYSSTIVNYPSFKLTYQLQNALNGIVTKSSSEEINIKLLIGKKA